LLNRKSLYRLCPIATNYILEQWLERWTLKTRMPMLQTNLYLNWRPYPQHPITYPQYEFWYSPLTQLYINQVN
jgi:hypothetical protein